MVNLIENNICIMIDYNVHGDIRLKMYIGSTLLIFIIYIIIDKIMHVSNTRCILYVMINALAVGEKY